MATIDTPAADWHVAQVTHSRRPPDPAAPTDNALDPRRKSVRLRRAIARLVLAAFLSASLALLTACSPALITVFAAASLANVLSEVGDAWQAQGSIHRVSFHFAGSNTLARQIETGASVDILISADRLQIDRSQQRLEGEARAIAGNHLVVIAPAQTPTAFTRPEDLLDFPRIAIADPDSAPAGAYSRRWLESLGLWQPLADRLVPTLDVRAALAAVSSNAAPIGIVYQTDAEGRNDVSVLWSASEPEAPQVRYWAALFEDGDRANDAEIFFDFLASEAVAKIFARHGFDPI